MRTVEDRLGFGSLRGGRSFGVCHCKVLRGLVRWADQGILAREMMGRGRKKEVKSIRGCILQSCAKKPERRNRDHYKFKKVQISNTKELLYKYM